MFSQSGRFVHVLSRKNLLLNCCKIQSWPGLTLPSTLTTGVISNCCYRQLLWNICGICLSTHVAGFPGGTCVRSQDLVCGTSRGLDFYTLWTVKPVRSPLFWGLVVKNTWVVICPPPGIFPPRDRTCVSWVFCIAMWILLPLTHPGSICYVCVYIFTYTYTYIYISDNLHVSWLRKWCIWPHWTFLKATKMMFINGFIDLRNVYNITW